MKTKEELISQVIPALNRAQENCIKAYYKKDDAEQKRWNDEFRLNALEVLMSGFRLAKRESNENGVFTVTWRLREPKSRTWKSLGNWVMFSPEHKYKVGAKNQCTTRCIYFCLEGKFGYDSIRREQERLAEVYRTKWNAENAWGRFLATHGFVKISLEKKIRRDRLAQLLKDFDTRICVHSSHHVSGIYKGDVYDLWDSRRGIADAIYVRKEFKDDVYEKLMESKCV